MACTAGAKWLKFTLLFFLIFAIICTLALSTGETFCFLHIGKDSIGSGVFLAPLDHTVDWLAEDTPTVGKAQGYSGTPLRNGILRIFSFAGLIVITMFLGNKKYQIIKNDNIPYLNNIIPLKLRI